MQKKFERIVDWVNAEIQDGSLARGERLPSENELMERFGVSRQTVRRALEELAENGLVEGRRGSGTYVTVNTRRHKDEAVRIAVMLTCVDTYIFPSIIKGIESVLTPEGCTMQIVMTDNAVEKERMLLKEFIRTRSVDGIIAETVKSGLPNRGRDVVGGWGDGGLLGRLGNRFEKEVEGRCSGREERMAG